MKLPKKLFDEKLNEYIESRLIPSIESPVRQFVIATALGTKRLSIGMFGDDIPKALGLVDEKGDVDTEAIRSAMTFGMKKVENDLRLLGLHFSQTDIDKLFAFFDAIPQPQPQPPKEG